MTKKDIAIKCMEAMDFAPVFIENSPCLMINCCGFLLDPRPELLAKVQEVEANYGCLVYAITKRVVNDMTLWVMLCVPEECSSEKEIVEVLSKTDRSIFRVYAYVWNETKEQFSEFGDVAINACYGGIRALN